MSYGSQIIATQLATATSMGSTFQTSSEYVVSVPKARGVKNYTIQGVWSAGSTPIGVLKLQCSNDGGSNWVDVGCTEVTVSGNTGSVMWAIQNHAYELVRVAYTRTSGSATFDAYYRALADQI